MANEPKELPMKIVVYSEPFDLRGSIKVYSEPFDLRDLTKAGIEALRTHFRAAVEDAIERTLFAAQSLNRPEPTTFTADKMLAAMREMPRVKDDQPPMNPARLLYHENRRVDALRIADALDQPPFSMRPFTQQSDKLPPGFIVAMSGSTVLWIIKPDPEAA
jgi:hypothetical protein